MLTYFSPAIPYIFMYVIIFEYGISKISIAEIIFLIERTLMKKLTTATQLCSSISYDMRVFLKKGNQNEII